VPAFLAHARPEQVQFVLDVELWHKDRLRTERLAPWLQRLVGSGEGALRKWVNCLDAATWTLMLGPVAKIHASSEESDPFQELPGAAPFTLDGLYYVSVPAPLEPLVREVLGTARAENPKLYQELVEVLTHPMESESEELGFEEKQRRLAERGFPEWEEAYEVYARLPAQSLDGLPRRVHASGASEDEGVAPRYPVALPGAAPDFLSRALRGVRDSVLEEVRVDLAFLTNKVMVADSLDPSQLESYERALRKVAGYVSVGLEFFCQTDETAASRAVEEYWLQYLFRAGWTRVREAQSSARRFLDKSWPAGKMERLLFLDPPLPQAIDGLLRRHPLCFAGVDEEPSFREFRSLTEVQKAERNVEKADFLGTFLLSVVDFRLKDLQAAAVRLDSESLTGRSVFLTALVNAALGKDFRFAPVPREDVRTGLSKLWNADAPPRRVKPDLSEKALAWSRAVGPEAEGKEGFLQEFIDEALALLEEEFGHLAPDEVPDPRFTKGLWIV
jgi:hypothetical protein